MRFILNSTYIIFVNQYYKQTFGSPMGSLLSPIIADITLQDLEKRALIVCYLSHYFTTDMSS